MKRFIIMLLLTFVLVSVPLSFNHPAVIAQDEDCDPAAAKQWLIDRQSYINATEDVLNAQGMGIPDAQMHLHNHLQAIEDLERPACADDVMMATYYFYNQIQHLFVCAAQSRSDCVTAMQARVKTYRDTIGTTISPVASIAGFSAVEYTDLRPEGWSLATSSTTTQTQPEQPIPQEGMPMAMSGSANQVYDPMVIPEGIYRATATTTGYLILNGTVLEGDCLDALLLFLITDGQATNGAQAVLDSNGCTVIWEASGVTAPYTVTWEKMN